MNFLKICFVAMNIGYICAVGTRDFLVPYAYGFYFFLYSKHNCRKTIFCKVVFRTSGLF